VEVVAAEGVVTTAARVDICLETAQPQGSRVAAVEVVAAEEEAAAMVVVNSAIYPETVPTPGARVAEVAAEEAMADDFVITVINQDICHVTALPLAGIAAVWEETIPVEEGAVTIVATKVTFLAIALHPRRIWAVAEEVVVEGVVIIVVTMAICQGIAQDPGRRCKDAHSVSSRKFSRHIITKNPLTTITILAK